MHSSTLPELYKHSFRSKPIKQGGIYSLDLSPSTSLPHGLKNKLFPTTPGQLGRKQSFTIKSGRKSYSEWKNEFRYKDRYSMSRCSNSISKIPYEIIYERSRGISNSMIQMQEIESLKNISDSLRQSVTSLKDVVGQTKDQIKEIGQQFVQIKDSFNQSIQAMELDFRKQCQQLGKMLSLLRRETNEEAKTNKLETTKVKEQISICKQYMAIMTTATLNLSSLCLDAQKTINYIMQPQRSWQSACQLRQQTLNSRRKIASSMQNQLNKPIKYCQIDDL